MNVHFVPPQLKAARMAALLTKVLHESVSPAEPGELRVLGSGRSEPTRLVYIGEGHRPASLSLPAEWLYSDLPEAQVREQLARLFSLKQPISLPTVPPLDSPRDWPRS